ncbi:MAG: hypothetical protein ACPG4Y_11035, partial [Chitinophagales bacterium]
ESICDTIYSHPLFPWDSTVNICQGDSFFAEGLWQTTTGLYFDTLFGAIPPVVLDTIFYDNFEGASAWNLSVGSGLDDWEISNDEDGLAPPLCSNSSNNGDNVLFVTNTIFSSTERAVYIDALGASNQDAISPNIATTNYTNINLNFDFISLGNGLDDNASVHYSINS